MAPGLRMTKFYTSLGLAWGPQSFKQPRSLSKHWGGCCHNGCGASVNHTKRNWIDYGLALASAQNIDFNLLQLSHLRMAPNPFPQVLSTSVVRYSPGRIACRVKLPYIIQYRNSFSRKAKRSHSGIAGLEQLRWRRLPLLLVRIVFRFWVRSFLRRSMLKICHSIVGTGRTVQSFWRVSSSGTRFSQVARCMRTIGLLSLRLTVSLTTPQLHDLERPKARVNENSCIGNLWCNGVTCKLILSY